MNILITGGAGFIGSNFIKYMVSKYNYRFIVLDKLTYAGNINNLTEIINNNKIHFVKGDITNSELVYKVFKQFDINIVINFAAESHVDRSINDPETFITTNIIGTQTLLKVANDMWLLDSSKKNDINYKIGTKFIQISTDEVYGTLSSSGFFTELSNLSPNSPYSASKASADLLVRAYSQTYGLPVNITRCSNNYGPHQFPEKLIPLVINNALKGKGIPIYGDGKQVRDWLHVEDHCRAIDIVLHKGQEGEVYNIGGNNEKTNIDIVRYILKFLGIDENIIEFVDDRLGHDRRYAINNKKISEDLDWHPIYTFNQGLDMTINWYLNNKEWLDNINTKKYLDKNKKY